MHGREYDKREIQKLLDHLQSRKKLVRLNDNRFLTTEAMEEIKKKVKDVIRTQGRFILQDAKAVLGYGRTHSIPVLEYLDTIGFTRRIGDERFLKKSK
jgi:selenocysteine-specific elongation factor